MQRLRAMFGLLLLPMTMSCQHGAPIGASVSAEEELRRVDLDQSRIAQTGNADAMAALLHTSYTAHLPNGRLSS